jgi:hypothetical protein
VVVQWAQMYVRQLVHEAVTLVSACEVLEFFAERHDRVPPGSPGLHMRMAGVLIGAQFVVQQDLPVSEQHPLLKIVNVRVPKLPPLTIHAATAL